MPPVTQHKNPIAWMQVGLRMPKCRLAVIAAIWGSAATLGTAAAAQDTGASAFGKCLACHAVGPGGKNKNGPVLNGVAGKPAGSQVGFIYSDAFQAAKTAGLIWTDEKLDKYLADPTGFMPGSHMAWAVPDETERRAIINYLKSLP